MFEEKYANHVEGLLKKLSPWLEIAKPVQEFDEELHGVSEENQTPLGSRSENKKWDLSHFSLDNLRDMYGCKQVTISPSLYSTNFMTGKLRDYLNYSFGDNKALGAPPEFSPYNENCTRENAPYYLINWDSTFLAKEISKLPQPACIGGVDFLDLLKGNIKDFLIPDSNWIYLGQAGAYSDLHYDHHSVHTYISQVKGDKLVMVFPPDDFEHMRLNNESNKCIDLFNSESKAVELKGKVTPYWIVLNPGDLVFIPSNWLHFAVCLQPSITLNRDSVDKANFSQWLNDYINDSEFHKFLIDNNGNSRAEAFFEELNVSASA